MSFFLCGWQYGNHRYDKKQDIMDWVSCGSCLRLIADNCVLKEHDVCIT